MSSPPCPPPPRLGQGACWGGFRQSVLCAGGADAVAPNRERWASAGSGLDKGRLQSFRGGRCVGIWGFVGYG